MRRLLVPVVCVGVLTGCATGVTSGVAVPEVVPIAEQPYQYGFTSTPLTDFLHGAEPSEADAAAEAERFRAEEVAAQETIAACMAEQGFSYVPFVLDFSELETVVDPADGLTRGEFAQRYGFGVSFEAELGGGGFHGGGLLEQGFTGYDVGDDPNEATRAELDEDAQQAWDTARYGAGHDGGCEGQAYGYADEMDPATAVVEAEIQVLEAEIAADPRSVDALGEYTVCMGAAGHDVASTDDAYFLASDRYYALLPDPFAELSEDEYAALGPAELEALDAQVVADPAELAVVQAAEIEMAVTDLRCLADVEPVLAAVRTERETVFLAEHPAELEVLRETYGG